MHHRRLSKNVGQDALCVANLVITDLHAKLRAPTRCCSKNIFGHLVQNALFFGKLRVLASFGFAYTKRNPNTRATKFGYLIPKKQPEAEDDECFGDKQRYVNNDET